MKSLRSFTGVVALLVLFTATATAIFVKKATVDGAVFDQAIVDNTDRLMRVAMNPDALSPAAFTSIDWKRENPRVRER